MNTPIYDFIYRYTLGNPSRFHMPGHKGSGLMGCESFDITEIKGADALYSADGIIAQSQKNAAELFGSRATLYSTEGSSLCIRAMLYLALNARKDKKTRPVIAASRNSHKVFVLTCALLDIDIIWLYGNSGSAYSCELSAKDVSNVLSKNIKGLCGVYLTSPDYLGKFCDIKEISTVCHEKDIPLIVDNAHGAYLKFLSQDILHPLDLGADMCCDSAHKTLPVLTGGAYLHVSKSSIRDFEKGAMQALSVFASTSPSYLTLCSLDLCNRYLCENKDAFDIAKEECQKLRHDLCQYGYEICSDEPLKITITPKSFGYTGFELSEILRNNAIEPEFCDPDFTVLMISPKNTNEDFKHLEKVLCSVNKKTPISDKPPVFEKCNAVMSAKDALFSNSECISVHESIGRILAVPNVSCPPAVPFVVCGERINHDAVKGFEYYGINEVYVVSEQ